MLPFKIVNDFGRNLLIRKMVQVMGKVLEKMVDEIQELQNITWNLVHG